jgi:DNA-directed RNA polymerase specialized sigma54-like protein
LDSYGPPPGTHPAKDHHDFTKPEREYVKGLVHNLSYQRLTDQEIVQWLHGEKQIDLDRSTVTKIKNQINIVWPVN